MVRVADDVGASEIVVLRLPPSNVELTETDVVAGSPRELETEGTGAPRLGRNGFAGDIDLEDNPRRGERVGDVELATIGPVSAVDVASLHELVEIVAADTTVHGSPLLRAVVTDCDYETSANAIEFHSRR